MRVLSLMVMLLVLSACQPCHEYDSDWKPDSYQIYDADSQYTPAKGRVFNVLGFKINEGQQMRDFFDDFEEPMHAKYLGNNVIHWTYYVDYDALENKGKLVRYCELDKYQGKKLCKLNVVFNHTYVGDATGTCR